MLLQLVGAMVLVSMTHARGSVDTWDSLYGPNGASPAAPVSIVVLEAAAAMPTSSLPAFHVIDHVRRCVRR